MFTSPIKRRIRKCRVVEVQWMSKKCTKKRDARAELLFCSYHKLYFDVIVAVVLRSCFNSLLSSCALNSCWPSFYMSDFVKTWPMGFRLAPGTAWPQASPVCKKVGGLTSWSVKLDSPGTALIDQALRSKLVG